jgi:hypothetical protein
MARWHNYVMASERFSGLPDRACTSVSLATTTPFMMTSRAKLTVCYRCNIADVDCQNFTTFRTLNLVPKYEMGLHCEDCLRITGFMDFVHRAEFKITRKRFGNRICFRLQGLKMVTDSVSEKSVSQLFRIPDNG